LIFNIFVFFIKKTYFFVGIICIFDMRLSYFMNKIFSFSLIIFLLANNVTSQSLISSINRVKENVVVSYVALKANNLFVNYQNQNSLEEKLLGSWNICSDSQIANPPSFLNCKYGITFYKSDRFEVFNIREDNLVCKGIAELKYHSEVNDKKLYRLKLIFKENKGFKSDDYIPKTSIVFFSNDSVIFLTNDTKDLASPYFLLKNRY